MTNDIRCFIALDLPASCTNELNRVQKELRKGTLFEGKYVELENLHLTFKFLGSLQPELVENVKTHLRTIKRQQFSARLGALGVFTPSQIRVIWVELHAPEITTLHQMIDRALCGLFPNEDRFQVHVTLARVRSVADKQHLLNVLKNLHVNPLQGTMHSFTLYQSKLSREGPVYAPLERYLLHG